MIDQPNYTQIPNRFLDIDMSTLSGSGFKVLMAVSRKVFGWHKADHRDRISDSQLMAMTGIASKDTLYKAVEEIKEHIGKEVIDHQTFYTILVTGTETVPDRYDYRTSAGTETVPTKETLKEKKERSLFERPGPARPPIPKVEPDFIEKVWIGDLQEMSDYWQLIYPDIDVLQEMDTAMAYAIEHPEKHYTKWFAYLSGWMRRTQGYAKRRRAG